jgi:hypothetical protein
MGCAATLSDAAFQACVQGYVDGQSRQSRAHPGRAPRPDPLSFCDWIIGADTGIHPSVAGHAQLAAALQALVAQNGLGPASP